MNLILLGAPGAGKGTQAEFISDRYTIPIIGTGNIIRDAMKEGTDFGKKVKNYIDNGELVPDDIVIEALKIYIDDLDSQNGFVLDGFPRTVAQAEALKDMGIVIDKVISIEIEDEVILKRLSGRRICGNCGSSYHMEFKQPVTPGKCDRCGGELIVRDDDRPEILTERLRIYHTSTAPVKDYYKNLGKLHILQSKLELAKTTAQTIKILEQ